MLIGKTFGRLTVVENKGLNKYGKTLWLCKCTCGNNIVAIGSSIIIGETKSCGCYKTEKLTKHSLSRSKEYRVWADMIQRCTNQKCANYKHYGARGIVVCKRWMDSFEAFLKDMGNRPSEKHSLERKDVNGNYTPVNCKWATRREQDLNRRNTRFIEHNGVKMVLCEWASFLNVGRVTLREFLEQHTFAEAVDRYTNSDYQNATDKRNFGKWNIEIKEV